MKLRGIDYGRVHCASGVAGFFGEGYWYHRWLRPVGLDFSGATFVAKTTTLLSRKGNMPLRHDYTPRELMPNCIKIRLLKGVALNAVGLSGPGAQALLYVGRWQAREDNFFLSFMSVEPERSKRLRELETFASMLQYRLPEFRGKVALQINYSCPNVGLEVDKLVDEVEEDLSVCSALGIPLVPKFNVLLPPATAVKISENSNCDGLCVSNTIPFGKLSDKIDWEEIFGSNRSPLAHHGGGGLSGKPLLPLLLRWMEEARRSGLKKPLCAGGGILSQSDARKVFQADADAIFLGSIAFLRPWRVRGIIKACAG